MAHVSNTSTQTKSATKSARSVKKQTRSQTKSEYPEAGSDDPRHIRLRIGGGPPTRGITDTSNSGFSIQWSKDGHASDYSRINISSNNQPTVTTHQQIRILHSTQDHTAQGVPSGNAGKYKLSFVVTQQFTLTGEEDLNTKEYNSISSVLPTRRGIWLTTRDDDAIDESPDYLNKEYYFITTGLNEFEIDCFDDGDASNPAITIMVNEDAVMTALISDIELYYLGAPS